MEPFGIRGDCSLENNMRVAPTGKIFAGVYRRASFSGVIEAIDSYSKSKEVIKRNRKILLFL